MGKLHVFFFFFLLLHFRRLVSFSFTVPVHASRHGRPPFVCLDPWGLR